MSEKKREADGQEQAPLRHKDEGHGTHGAPTERKGSASAPTEERDQPEGNGATGKPAAFPPHN